MDVAAFRKSDNVEDRRGRWYGKSVQGRLQAKADDEAEKQKAREQWATDQVDKTKMAERQVVSPSQGNNDASLDDAIIGRRRAKRSLMEKDQDEIAMKVALEDLSDLTQGKPERKRHERWYGVEAKETETKGEDNG